MYCRLFMSLLSVFHGELRREESQDHAFGDAEVYIMWGDEEVGFGYFGGGLAEMRIFNFTFLGKEARDIREKIPVGKIGRNDSTGPDDFVIDRVMPGLTREGVRQELLEF